MKPQVLPCHLLVTDPRFFSSRSHSLDHAAASFLTLFFSSHLFFHAYSLNSALAPMGSLAWQVGTLSCFGSDRLHVPPKSDHPPLGGRSYPLQPPGGKSQLPALQEVYSKHPTGVTGRRANPTSLCRGDGQAES